ncbi:MAG TPA: arginine--tRNA ligase [Candidatus Aminicenantes bacterium]|nr:arginine--tRNA ligase [Candidatus Aminicenantes bacterium]
MKRLERAIARRMAELLAPEFSLTPAEIVFTVPPERRFGDLSTNLPFLLAKRTREKPFLIGQRMLARLVPELSSLGREAGAAGVVATATLAGGGFLNLSLQRDLLWQYLLAPSSVRDLPVEEPGKTVVEHTSINPNKAAHIGHLRNSCLGDTLARCLRFLGHPVEVQNYIDDTGIQVADVVWGLLRHERLDLAAIRQIPDLAGRLWTSYPEYSTLLGGDEALAAERNEVHKRIEEKHEPEFSACLYVAEAVLRDQLEVMDRLGIRYDLLAHESDVIARGFFTAAAKRLKAAGILTPAQEEEHRGCWVIRYRKEDIEKIVIRSNGTVTYVGKDIAYHLWKLGLLGLDFEYRPFPTYPGGYDVWQTCSEGGQARTEFGRARAAVNVIDVRQSYLQGIIGQVLEELGDGETRRSFVHFAYEMVALTPACVRELGFPLSPEDEKRPYIEVSGRKGIAVKAADLLDRLEERSRAEVTRRNPALDSTEAVAIARSIAVGALRFFMVQYSLRTVIAFDFQQVLNFEGDSGPYLQYTLVRLASILRRLPAEETAVPAAPTALPAAEQDLFWEIVLRLSQAENTVMLAVSGRELSGIAQYAVDLCRRFNNYYHQFPVLAEKDPAVRALRVAFLGLFQRRMKEILGLLGIPVPERM